PETFPVRAPKHEGRLRRGAAFVVVRADGFLLLRSRPPSGLLGGMTEVPTSEWRHDFDDAQALMAAPPLRRPNPKCPRLAGSVRHVSPHFPRRLIASTAPAAATTPAPAGMRWVALTDVADEALPNLMRKVVAHALPEAPPPDVMDARKQ